MTSFSTSELTAMQAAQDGHMMDTCTVDAYADGGPDAYGNSDPSWTPGSAIVCGFKPVKVAEGLEASEVPLKDAVIRLPIGTSLTNLDRITVTHRHGVAVTNVTYAIVGEAKRGPSGLQVDVKRVTDGS